MAFQRLDKDGDDGYSWEHEPAWSREVYRRRADAAIRFFRNEARRKGRR